MKEHLFSLSKKDFKIQTFKSGGPGGQHQNKTDSGVRIFHVASGAKGESRNSRSQAQNKRTAFKRLAETSIFKLWVKRKAHEIINNISLDDIVAEAMSDDNLKIEIKDSDGRWT